MRFREPTCEFVETRPRTTKKFLLPKGSAYLHENTLKLNTQGPYHKWLKMKDKADFPKTEHQITFPSYREIESNEDEK